MSRRLARVLKADILGVILVIGGIIGIVITSLYYYSVFIPLEASLPKDEHGIIAFSTPLHSNRTFQVIIDELDFANRSAKVTIWFGGGVPQPFGFQVPYRISLSEQSSHSWRKIPDENSTWVFCAECPPDGQLVFTCHEMIQRRTYGTYAIVVPFSDKSYITSSQVELLRSQFLDGSLVEFYGIRENYYQLTIRLPEGVSPQLIEPTPIYFGRISSKLWFYYDISEYGRKGWEALTGDMRVGAQPIVYMIVSLDSQQNYEKTVLFWSGIGFGTAVPTVVSGFVELIKGHAGRSRNAGGHRRT